MQPAVQIRGLRELNHALQAYNKDLQRELRDELRDAAEPVRGRAESLASSSISNIGFWSQMRTGVTSRVVYVAPRRRRRGGSPRPNLAGLLMGQAMEPALDAEQGQVVRSVESMLDRLGRENGF